MSLSFVSKSVQTAKEDGGFEEKPIEPKDGGGGSDSGGTSKSLFEQLRANQEEADAEREEQERAMMRGTVELNDDDKAHLQALDRQRQQAEQEKQKSTQEALAAFRAARADRMEATISNTDEPTNALSQKRSREGSQSTTKSKNPASAPILVVKKKKRRVQNNDSNSTKTSINSEKNDKGNPHDEKKSETKEGNAEKPTGVALGGLLAGYGSSDSED